MRSGIETYYEGGQLWNRVRGNTYEGIQGFRDEASGGIFPVENELDVRGSSKSSRGWMALSNVEVPTITIRIPIVAVGVCP